LLYKIQKTKPKQTQFKPNFRKAKMDVNLYVIEDYRKKDDFAVRKNKPNSNPIFLRTKPMQSSLSQRIMKMKQPAGLEKTNPIKPNFPAPLIRVLPAPKSSHRGFTLRGPVPKLRRLLITLFGSGYAGLGHSGSVYFQCAYPCNTLLLLKKHAKKIKKKQKMLDANRYMMCIG